MNLMMFRHCSKHPIKGYNFPNSSLMSLWSPCGLYANLPYGYAASTNYINPTYNGVNYNNLPYDDASVNLNDLTFENTSNNYTGISDTSSSLANLPYSIVTSSQTNLPTFNPTTESPDDQFISTINTNLPINKIITGNNSLSKR